MDNPQDRKTHDKEQLSAFSEDCKSNRKSELFQDLVDIIKTYPKIINKENETDNKSTMSEKDKLVQAVETKNETNTDASIVSSVSDKIPICANKTSTPSSVAAPVQIIYREGQWSPNNPHGRKIYDREQLVALSKDPKSNRKPNLLSLDLDVIKNYPKQYRLDRLAESNRFSSMDKPHAGEIQFPEFGKSSVSQRGPLSKQNSPKKGKIKAGIKPIVHVTLSLTENVKLNETENDKKPASFKPVQEHSEEDAKTEELYKKVRDVLNKLTHQNVDTLVSQIKNFDIDNCERLQGVIDLIFEKATDETNYLLAYMCHELASMQVPVTKSKNSNSNESEYVNFSKLLITRCQMEFEKNYVDKTAQMKRLKEIEEETDSEKKKELEILLEEDNRRVRLRSVRNVKFIGVLFKQEMLTANVMMRCLNNLLTPPMEEENLECLCELLKTVGKDLEIDKEMSLQQYFQTVQEIVDKKYEEISMLQDVIDLRNNRWIPLNQDLKPTAIDQIQKEANAEDKNYPQETIQQIIEKLQGAIIQTDIKHEKEVERLERENKELHKQNLFLKRGSKQSQVDSLVQDHHLENLTGGKIASTTNNVKLTFDQIRDKLLEFFRNDVSFNHITEWISTNIGEEGVKEKEFIRALVTAVCEHSIQNMKFNEDIFKKYLDLLFRYIDNKPDRKVQCLHALQACFHKLENPPGTEGNLQVSTSPTTFGSQQGPPQPHTSLPTRGAMIPTGPPSQASASSQTDGMKIPPMQTQSTMPMPFLQQGAGVRGNQNTFFQQTQPVMRGSQIPAPYQTPFQPRTTQGFYQPPFQPISIQPMYANYYHNYSNQPYMYQPQPHQPFFPQLQGKPLMYSVGQTPQPTPAGVQRPNQPVATVPMNHPNQIQQPTVPKKTDRSDTMPLIDPTTGKNILKKLSDGDKSAPQNSNESSACETPQPDTQVEITSDSQKTEPSISRIDDLKNEPNHPLLEVPKADVLSHSEEMMQPDGVAGSKLGEKIEMIPPSESKLQDQSLKESGNIPKEQVAPSQILQPSVQQKDLLNLNKESSGHNTDTTLTSATTEGKKSNETEPSNSRYVDQTDNQVQNNTLPRSQDENLSGVALKTLTTETEEDSSSSEMEVWSDCKGN